MIDSIWALIIPVLVNAFNVVVLRAFFQGIPQELIDSALIDGASEWQIFRKIILPLSKAILAHLHGRSDLQGLRRWLLFTRDAHALYAQFGWEGLAHPERAMVQDHPEVHA